MVSRIECAKHRMQSSSLQHFQSVLNSLEQMRMRLVSILQVALRQVADKDQSGHAHVKNKSKLALTTDLLCYCLIGCYFLDGLWPVSAS